MLKGGACSMAVLGYLEEVAPADSEQVVDDGHGAGGGIHTARFSGQKFCTLNFTEIRQFW